MVKFITITSALLIVLTLSMNAQERTLEGVVTDAQGNPLKGVTVVPEGTELSSQTDEKGYYKIESVPASVITLRFTHPDMENASATIGIYTTVDVVMSQVGSENLYEYSLEDLLNMEVTTASKSAEKQSDAPGAISVLTKDEINRFGGTTLKDLLERMPGLIGSTVYMTDRSTIAPRGDQVLASSSHVLLLINGRPVREALEGGIKSEMYEAFPVNIIEKIEVIRGPGSVLYGSNAVSAVINVITENAEENTLDVTGIAGESGAYGAQAKGKFKTGDLSVVVSGRYMKKADWETDFSYSNVITPVDTTVTAQTKIPNEGIGMYFGVDYKNLRLMGSYTEWDHSYFIADYGTAIPIPTYGTCNWAKRFIDLGYGLPLSDMWSMDFNLTYTRSTFNTESWPNTNRDSYEVVGEWSNFIKPTEKLDIVFGGLYNYFDGEEWGPMPPEERFVFTDANRYSFGAYAQLNYQLLSNLNVIGGLQANKVEDIDLNVVPRAGLIWYPISKVNVKAFYSQAFRAPSINEFSINFPEMQGNPDLTPEEISTIDIGVGYQGEQVHAGISFFYTQMQNIIFQNRDTTEVPAPMYSNGAEVKFMGVELEGKYYINREFYITGSMLYQTNEDKDGNENVTPLANLGFKAGISYASDNGLTIGIFNIYQGVLDEKYESLLNVSPGAYNLLNVHCRYNINKLLNLGFLRDVSLYVQADNLLDKEIWLTDWGLAPGKSIPVNQGRAIYFGLNVGF